MRTVLDMTGTLTPGGMKIANWKELMLSNGQKFAKSFSQVNPTRLSLYEAEAAVGDPLILFYKRKLKNFEGLFLDVLICPTEQEKRLKNRSGLIYGTESLDISLNKGGLRLQSGTLASGKLGGRINVKGSMHCLAEKHKTMKPQNYFETASSSQIFSEGLQEIEVDSDLIFEAIKTDCFDGLHVKSKTLLDVPLFLESGQFSTELTKKKAVFKKSVQINPECSFHKSNGDIYFTTEEKQDLHAPKYQAKSFKFTSETKEIIFHDVHSQSSTEEHISKVGGDFGKKENTQKMSQSRQSIGGQIISEKNIEITAHKGVIFKNIKIKAPKTTVTALEGIVKFLMGENHSQSSESISKDNLFWVSQESKTGETLTFSQNQIEGEMELHTPETIIEQTRTQTLDFLKTIENQGTHFIEQIREEIHKNDNKKVQGPTTALSAVVSIAIGLATGGAASFLGGLMCNALGGSATHVIGTMTAAGFKSICLQAGQAILNSAGNLKKAGKSLAQWSTVKNMGKAVVLAAIAPVSPGNEATWTQELQYQFLDKTTCIGVDVLFGEKLEDSFKSNVRAFGSDFIGAELAKRIGKVRQTGEVPDILLNLCHGVNGGIQGWIRNNDPWSGAFGAFMAETFMDLFSPEQGPLSMKSTIEEMERQKGDKLTREEFLQVYNAELKNYANACKTSARELMAYSRMTTAVTSMLIGLNPEVSEHTGGIALENNTWGVVLSGISICFGGYEIYQLKCVYDEDGVPGVLKKLGIDKM